MKTDLFQFSLIILYSPMALIPSAILRTIELISLEFIYTHKHTERERERERDFLLHSLWKLIFFVFNIFKNSTYCYKNIYKIIVNLLRFTF